MRKEKEKKDSESSDDDNDSQQSIQFDVGPKIIPVSKLSDKLRNKKIIINISDTQYPIIEEIAEQLQWQIQTSETNGEWDVWWTDRQIGAQTLFKMNLHQKINHYPGINVLARKNMLALNLMAMKEHFATQYNFFPDTWIIPIQFSQFRNFYQSVDRGKTRTYIVKPEALSQGRGIFLTRSIDDIMTGHKYVVQRYIKNPLLIDGLKFDLRIYVLIAGTEPLRAYIYEDGLARFATERYSEPNDYNLSHTFVHLTNYSLNKNNPHYVYNTNQNVTNVGHKWTLKAAYDKIAKMGHDVEKIKDKINDIIVKTLIAGLPALSHQYKYCQPEEYQNNMCFHILGFDIMLTNLLEPILIEVNHTPSFETSTPLDCKVKKNLIIDTFNLMRINSQNKKKQFERAKAIIKKRLQTGKRQILKGKQRQILIVQAQMERDKSQEGHLGGFTKIHPTTSEDQNKIYEDMIKKAVLVHRSTDEARIKLIREEQEQCKKNKKKVKEQEKKEKSRKKSFQVNSLLEKGRQTTHERKLSTIQKQAIAVSRQKIQIERELVQKKSLILQPKIDINPSKTMNFRSKVKKTPILHPVDELMRFSEIMMKVVVKRQMKSPDDQLFFKASQSILHDKSKEIKEKMVRNTNSKGTFVKPQTYHIVDSRSYKIIDIPKKSFQEPPNVVGTQITTQYKKKKKRLSML